MGEEWPGWEAEEAAEEEEYYPPEELPEPAGWLFVGGLELKGKAIKGKEVMGPGYKGAIMDHGPKGKWGKGKGHGKGYPAPPGHAPPRMGGMKGAKGRGEGWRSWRKGPEKGRAGALPILFDAPLHVALMARPEPKGKFFGKGKNAGGKGGKIFGTKGGRGKDYDYVQWHNYY